MDLLLSKCIDMTRPYAESADQNKRVIAEVLEKLFVTPGNVLEIGAGTGQHALYFASLFPHLYWTPSDVSSQIRMLDQGIVDSGFANVSVSLTLDVDVVAKLVKSMQTLSEQYDYIYTANTLHIMSWASCINLLSLVSSVLPSGGIMVSYGPYNVDGKFTSDSNARFEQWLKQRNPVSGIRDIADLRREGLERHLEIKQVIEMPANNKILVWSKI